jgi:hypothetical protein
LDARNIEFTLHPKTDYAMKKILLLSAIAALFSLSFSVSTAQTFEAEKGDTSIASYNGNSTLGVYNRLRSTSSTAVNLQWRMTYDGIPASWYLTGVCDNIACRSASDSRDATWKGTAQYGSNYNNAANDFHIAYENMTAVPNNTTAVAQITVRDATNTSSQKILTFIATKGATGVVNVSRTDDEVVLYPNPAREAINVLFNEAAGIKNIALYNLIGKPVMVYRVQDNNSAKLDLNSVASGVYFMRLMNAQGNVVATRRFTRQ